LLEKGFLDQVVHRNELKARLSSFLGFLMGPVSKN
jgi:acetyl-CoA carboxylase beta subunit